MLEQKSIYRSMDGLTTVGGMMIVEVGGGWCCFYTAYSIALLTLLFYRVEQAE